MKLLDPRNDFIFKKIFGNENNKDVLLAFLNSTFLEAGEPPLTEIILLNPYTDKNAPQDKQSILDIKAKTTEGQLVNIEMQLFNPYFMEKRTLFYWSNMYFHQLQKGRSYSELKKCVTINILNYNCLPNDRYHNVFHLREDHTLIPLIEDIEVHVMELPKLPQQPLLKAGSLSNWLLFLKGVSPDQEEVLTMNEPLLKKAMETLELLSQDEQTRIEYEARLKYLFDETSRLEGARAEGIAKGIAEGIAEGKQEVARNLLAAGVDIAVIFKASGLSEAEILKLKD